MPLRTPTRIAADAGGRLLSAATAGLAAARPARKPLHPLGVVVGATLERYGSSEPTGVSLLDEPGTSPALVRLSRAVGLPARCPDIHGLALRILDETEEIAGSGGVADLLLASTGSSRLGRFVLAWSVHPDTWPLTTLLPYRSPTGPLLLAARREGSDAYALSWARPAGEWRRFGSLVVGKRERPDQEVSFDPVLHRVPGLEQYPVVVRLREPAYRRARRSRS